MKASFDKMDQWRIKRLETFTDSELKTLIRALHRLEPLDSFEEFLIEQMITDIMQAKKNKKCPKE